MPASRAYELSGKKQALPPTLFAALHVLEVKMYERPFNIVNGEVEVVAH
jgi:hypothetical protein